MHPSIVILDARYANPGDLSWSELEELGQLTVYTNSLEDEVIPRSIGAEVLVVNKIKLSKSHFKSLPNLKMICITATGTDNVDIQAANQCGIMVKNAVGYSTHSVAQHVFSLVFHFTNKVNIHQQSVIKGDWNTSKGFSYTLDQINDLEGKNIGVYGFGKIGQRVALLAQAFNMKVLVTSTHANPKDFPDYQFLTLEQLFSQSDIVSIHAPLTPTNHSIINKSLLKLMKSTSLLINTARGALINEQDLKEVLLNQKIGGAGLDVLSNEPPLPDNPLIGLPNCIVTPHIAWTSFQSRKELIRITADNIRRYLNEKSPT